MLREREADELGEVVDAHLGIDLVCAADKFLDPPGLTGELVLVVADDLLGMSSKVMMPSVPPYSSMTMAIWCRVRLKSLSSSDGALLSGTMSGGLAKSRTGLRLTCLKLSEALCSATR